MKERMYLEDVRFLVLPEVMVMIVIWDVTLYFGWNLLTF